jgi:helicase
MKMQELIRYDVPEAVLALWQTRESEQLLPLQELAVKRHDLFGNGNLLVQAPTSSGKTFIGEMAAIQTALRRKRVVYLVPLKALAEEKYRDFKEKYTDYGLKVIISTRDHREYDYDFEQGSFAIAVVVYEKLSQLLVRRPERMEEIDLVLADELEILSDPERGAMAELLLTRILQAKCRLIGLSAVIGQADRLAAWMKGELVFYERRPVELRYGVLHEGRFKYRTYNAYGEGEEQLSETFGEISAWEVLCQNVCAFVEQDEASLIFVRAKHEARRGAELLATRVELPAADTAIEALQHLEATRARDSLLSTLNSGVAFHNADLSPEERRIVEQAFRAGEVKVMVSTSTLAVGLNMPAQNVFLSAEKWRYDQRLGIPWKTPILHTEYENMGGRAGRLGAGHPFGRSILIATSPFDEETLWRRYVDGEREAIHPRLAREALEDHVLRLVASRFCTTTEELLAFLESTITGQWVWAERFTIEEIEFRIRAAVNRCIDAGMVLSDIEGNLTVTSFGMAVASKGIAIATARELAQWIVQSVQREWSDIDLIFAVANTVDGRMFQVMLTAKEYEHADYVQTIKQVTRDEELHADVPLNRIRNCTLMPFFEEVRAVKIALFLNQWLDHGAMSTIEEEYNTMAGQVLSAADQVSWLIDATAALATAMSVKSALVERLQDLAARVQHGLREEILPLARLHAPALNRNTLLALYAEGLHTAEALAALPVEALTQWVSKVDADRLKVWALQSVQFERGGEVAPIASVSEPVRPVLIVDDARPGEILVDGVRVALQEKQFRLIQLLAERPGECMPYDSIYDGIWGDVIVEGSNQMHFQKRNLLKRIGEAVSGHDKLITTVPKRGFVLNLKAEEVLLRIAASSIA